MKNAKKVSVPQNENGGIAVTRKQLMAEIRRIAGFKMPLSDKMAEIRYLIEQYFQFDGHEEALNANLP